MIPIALITYLIFMKLFNILIYFQCIENEFISGVENHIESVVILIGSSVLNPLTVFNINVPELSYSHSEKQHSSRQHIDNVFR